MAAGRNRWKMFGIGVIVALILAAIALPAYFLSRDSDDDEGRDANTRSVTKPAESSPEIQEETGGAAVEDDEDAAVAPEAESTATETTAPERYVTGEGEGETPCVDGTYTVTRTTYYSDGSTDTVTTTRPCP